MSFINRGFEAMLPQDNQEDKPLYEFKIGFSLFKKDFSLRFNVKRKE